MIINKVKVYICKQTWGILVKIDKIYSLINGFYNLSNPSTELLFSQRIIGGFPNKYFSRHICSTFYLRHTPGDIRVEAIFYGNSYNKSQSNFIVCAGGHPRTLTPAIALFSAMLLPTYFSHVATLHQSIAPAHHMGPLFCEFMTIMVTLEKLHVTTGGLNLFGVLQQHFFPRLKILVWVPSITNAEEWEEGTDLITDFLAMRRKMGFPIETLGWEMLSGVPMDIKRLEEFIGLKVVWREISDVGADQREYICGSGRLQELGVEE